MIKILKQEIDYLNSLIEDDYLGNSGHILSDEIIHCQNLIKLYEEA